jgi:hypothetical protein
MGAFFESALLFSLAVLIILIGLLVYYFKGRVVDLEQKNAKCLEIINDVYNSHCLLKQTVTAMLMEAADEEEDAPEPPKQVAGHGLINVEIEETVPEIDDSSRVSYTDDDDDDMGDYDVDTHTKTIHVDLNAPETYDLDALDVEEMPDDEANSNEDDVSIELDETAPEIHVTKTENNEEPMIKQQQQQQQQNNSDDYKKMSVVALRGFILSKGIQTDMAKLRKMSKPELIELVTAHAATQDNE